MLFTTVSSTPLDGRLTPRLTRRLAAMYGAPEPAILSAIAAMPLSARLVLAGLNVITIEPAGAPGEPRRIGLTERTLPVIRECAEWDG